MKKNTYIRVDTFVSTGTGEIDEFVASLMDDKCTNCNKRRWSRSVLEDVHLL